MFQARDINLDLTPWLGIPLGAIVGGLAGAVIGYPTLPAARPLLRPGDARLSIDDALRVPVARLSGGEPADEAGRAASLYAVRRPARLCRAGARIAGRGAGSLAGRRELALWHGALGDQAERAGCRSSGDRYLALEDAGDHAERGARRYGGGALRRGAAGGDTRERFRHVGFGPAVDFSAVWRHRQAV